MEAVATLSLEEALIALDREAPNAPLLALGQTIFWDEPMKAGLVSHTKRPFVAGIHDTDYFAKLPGRKNTTGFKLVAHNDTSTKGLWSAAAEFSALFGSETVVTRETYQRHGARFHVAAPNNPRFIDEATEAWGWRVLVALADEAPITAEVKGSDVFPAIQQALGWAIEQTLASISEPDRLIAKERTDALMSLVNNASDTGSLADIYERLLPQIARFVTGEDHSFVTTRTTKLLRFNTATCDSPRFDLPGLFLNPVSRTKSIQAYNEAVSGSETYDLNRFMSGAIPFDLVVPGCGRGTVRIANHAIIIMTPKPIFISLSEPIRSCRDFAKAIESKLGTECCLIGKAVTLIGMLAREFVFVFHEGASRYVSRSRVLHQKLADAGYFLHMHPILRVRYEPWDAIRHCHSWLRLPEPLHRPFGTEEICAPSIAARWHDVQDEQSAILKELRQRVRPIDLIDFLRDAASQSWKCLAAEYHSLHDRLSQLDQQLEKLRAQRRIAYGNRKEAIGRRVRAEIEKGKHFRAHIFEKSQSEQEQAHDERIRLTQLVEDAIHDVAHWEREIRDLLRQQREMARETTVMKDHDRRRSIEREAELKRIRMIRWATVATTGLDNAARRPSAWWFPVVCPDGDWFRETIRSASCYLEPLS